MYENRPTACSSWADLVDEMMMLSLPSRRIWSRACVLAPSPTDSIATTLLTPNTTPSIVSKERIRCKSKVSMPSRISRAILVRPITIYDL